MEGELKSAIATLIEVLKAPLKKAERVHYDNLCLISKNQSEEKRPEKPHMTELPNSRNLSSDEER